MTKPITETPYNTQIPGKVAMIREKSISIQTTQDGECFLVVPRHRVPQAVQQVGASVTIFITTRYGHFGVIGVTEN
jgi:hypothetical protein